MHYHDVLTVSTDCTPTPSSPSLSCNNAFPGLYSGADTVYVLGNGGEAFAINYGSAGIGSEILANRLGVGPEGGCVECRFEEFFLSSWAVGDPAMLVGHPDGLANNTPPQQVPYQPKTVLRTDDEAKYPDDPSNVYHSYIGDRVIFRIVTCGSARHTSASSPRTSMAAHAQQRHEHLSRQPAHQSRLDLYPGDRLRRQRQQEPHAGRRHLPLPFLSPLRRGHVGALAQS